MRTLLALGTLLIFMGVGEARLGPDQGAPEDVRFAAGATMRVLLAYDHPPTSADVAAVEAVGGVIHRRWTGVVWALAADMNRSQVRALLSVSPGILHAELSRPTASTMAWSTRQLGLRAPYPRPRGPGPTGAGEVVAILDSGFDASHPDLAGRLVAWADFAGAVHGQGNDEYPQARDADGHGTAVAGMVGGSGAGVIEGVLPLDDRVPVSVHGRFHGRLGWCSDAPLSLGPPGANGEVTVELHPEVDARRYRLSLRRYVDEGQSPNGGNEQITSREGRGDGIWQFDLRMQPPFGTYLCPFPEEDALLGTPLELRASIPYAFRDGRPLMAGAAPDVRFVALKVGDDRGAGNSCTHIDGYEWLYQNARRFGVSVANISRATNRGNTVLLEDAAINNLVREKGILFVTTAGNGWNRGQDQLTRVGSPGSAKDAVTVAAVNQHDLITHYSQPGDPAQSVRKPDVAAPGGSFRTPLLLVDSNDSGCADRPCAPGRDPFPDDYKTADGTSFAAPMVAGLFARMLEAEGGSIFEYAQVLRLRAALQMTATRVEGRQPGSPEQPPRDAEHVQGFGRVNPQAALDALVTELPAEVVQATRLDSVTRAFARRIPLVGGRPVVVRAVGAGAEVRLRLFDSAVADTPSLPNRRVMECGGDDPADPPAQPAAALPQLLAVTGAAAVPEDPCACRCARPAAPLPVCVGSLDGGEPRLRCPEACAALGRGWADGWAEDADCGGVACTCTAPPAVELCASAFGDREGAAGRCPAVCAAAGREWTGGWTCDANTIAQQGCPAVAAALLKPIEDGEAVAVLTSVAGDGLAELRWHAGPPLCDAAGAALVGRMPCAVGLGECRALGRLSCPARDALAVCDARPGAPAVEACGTGLDEDCDGEVDEGCEIEDAGPPLDAGVVMDAAPMVDAASVVDAMPVVDAVPVIDAAALVDAVPVIDAAALVDAVSVIDAAAVADAAPLVDAAPRVDAVIAPDATPIVDAAPRRDAAASPADAQVDARPQRDAAPLADEGPGVEEEGGGCGCRARGGGSAAGAWWLVLLWGWRRRLSRGR